eukprot:1180600-Pyramimonas_sp.AAC.1
MASATRQASFAASVASREVAPVGGHRHPLRHRLGGRPLPGSGRTPQARFSVRSRSAGTSSSASSITCSSSSPCAPGASIAPGARIPQDWRKEEISQQ